MKNLFLIIALLLASVVGNAQERRPIMLGISPAATFNKDYPSGAFDLNICPIAIQFPAIINNLDIRLLGLVNYGFRNYNSAIISVGGELTLPYHFDFGNGHKFISKGFFIGPGVAYKRNVHYLHSNTSIFLEPGYHFLFNENFSLIIDFQYGRKYFRYDSGQKVTQNHLGLKIVLGWWI
ncbi:MAG: hypothetical protein PHE33_09640 [Bacteroidales bacterium]|nr:hypothetical protein [Bacteroidales bacterium]